MGRPSKLSLDQWAEIERRMLNGEAVRALAREFEIQPSVIRDKLSARVKSIKSTAEQLAAGETSLRCLPVTAQIVALDYVERLKSISNNMLAGADYSAKTFHRMAAFAHGQTDQIDEKNPGDETSAKAIQAAAGFTALANKAAEVPLALVSAGKARELQAEQSPDHRTPEQIRLEAEGKAAVLGLELRGMIGAPE
jgi:hypothetical protein